MLTIVSASLHPNSKSRLLAKEAMSAAQELNIKAILVDLRDTPLTLCDGHESFSQPHVETLANTLRNSTAVLFASPVYNYDVSSALKNLIEHVGSELQEKVVGFLAAAGGQRSYMSALPFLNSLMLDFRTIIVPRHVHAGPESFGDDSITDFDTRERIKALVQYTNKLAQALTD